MPNFVEPEKTLTCLGTQKSLYTMAAAKKVFRVPTERERMKDRTLLASTACQKKQTSRAYMGTAGMKRLSKNNAAR